jgi:hypothetical protein
MTAASNGVLIDYLDEIHTTSAVPGGSERAMQLADKAADELIGHRLFTALVVHHDTMEVERLYSSMPAAYPVQGRKKKRATWWGGHVIEQGLPFVGTGPADLEKAFADHALIKSLGLNCVINMPLVYGGKTHGTVNILHAGAHYRETQIPLFRVIASTLLPVMLTAGA